MQPPPNERDLIERAQQGDKSAVSILYEAYVQGIFQYISYRVESDTVAEDLTGDVFLRMVRGLAEYKYTGAPLGAWLYRIAANRIADYYRENRYGTAIAISEETESDSSDLFSDMAQKEEQTHLREALQSLSEDYQNVLILRFIKDMPHAEVAEAMGKTESAVRIMQHRALKALAGVLGKITGNTSERRNDQHE